MYIHVHVRTSKIPFEQKVLSHMQRAFHTISRQPDNQLL